ncbi:hypothetical protein [Edwardsiella phage PVN06]|nr:hypothetical protein [Edwardsiella phage PVN06]
MTTLPKLSDASRWMMCQGSVQANVEFPASAGDISQSVLEGRACHEIAHKILSVFKGDPDAPLFSDLVGSLSSDGVLITDELFEVAREYANHVSSWCRAHDAMTRLTVEARVDLGSVITGWYGKCDAYAVAPIEKRVAFWELKAGHRPVDIDKLWQLIGYAAGFALTIPHTELTEYTFDLYVVQPRCFRSGGSTQHLELSYQQLMQRAGKLFETAGGIVAGDTTCRAGTHCIGCRGAGHCNVLSTESFAAMDCVGSLVTHTLTPEQLGVELAMIERYSEMMKLRKTALEEQASHALRTGTRVPGWELKERKGRESWRSDAVEQVLFVGDALGVDLRKPADVITPAQARKKGVDASVISAYTEHKSSMVLSRVDTDKIKRIFTQE